MTTPESSSKKDENSENTGILGLMCRACMIVTLIVAAGVLFLIQKGSMIDVDSIPVIYERDQWMQWEKTGFPVCVKPMLLKGVFGHQNNGECLKKDNCKEHVRNEIIKIFGENTVNVFAVNETSNPKGDARHYNPMPTKINEFLTDPKFVNTGMPGARFGPKKETMKFWKQMQNLAGDSATYVNDWNWLTNMPNGWEYRLTIHFAFRGMLAGSHMHWAWAENVFILLSGSKRWILVPPKYLLGEAGCVVHKSGLNGHCYPNGYTGVGTFADRGEVSMDELVEHLKLGGVPEKDILDLAVEAGDVLVNCHAWPHGVTQTDDETVAFTFRYGNLPPSMHIDWTVANLFLQSFWNSVKTIASGSHIFTFAHGILATTNLDDDDRDSSDIYFHN